MLDSSAPTHNTPGATMRKVLSSGPMPSGNKAATTTKKNTAVSTSLLRRMANNKSRRNTAMKAV